MPGLRHKSLPVHPASSHLYHPPLHCQLPPPSLLRLQPAHQPHPCSVHHRRQNHLQRSLSQKQLIHSISLQYNHLPGGLPLNRFPQLKFPLLLILTRNHRRSVRKCTHNCYSWLQCYCYHRGHPINITNQLLSIFRHQSCHLYLPGFAWPFLHQKWIPSPHNTWDCPDYIHAHLPLRHTPTLPRVPISRCTPILPSDLPAPNPAIAWPDQLVLLCLQLWYVFPG